MTDLNIIGQQASVAARALSLLTTEQKNKALLAIADAIEANADTLLAQNEIDMAAGKAKGLTDALLDRLHLTPQRIQALANDTRQVATLPDPVGAAIDSRVLPNGLHLTRRRIPIGVIGVIYEARPNVTIDVAALCLKTGNASILRGGSETYHSNMALVTIIRDGLTQAGVPADAVQYIDNPDRQYVRELLRLDTYVDMIIPRGGARLHELCKNESNIPVITGGVGICHIFVDESADFARGLDIIENSKIQKPSACNALDTVLVHQNIAGAFVPQLVERMADRDVAIRADALAMGMIPEKMAGDIAPADDDAWDTEWLSYTVGIKIVTDLDEAVAHIQAHSLEHSDAILTNDWRNANAFVDAVNSCAVFVNASTRFNDGGQFGLGAEVAVSTQKLHARGPMGLEELTTYKWIGVGDGHIRL